MLTRHRAALLACSAGLSGTVLLDLREKVGCFRHLSLANRDARSYLLLSTLARLRQELGGATVEEEVLPPGLGADQLPRQRHDRHGVGLQLRDRVKLFVGSIVVSGETEQVSEKRPPTDIGRARLHLRRGRGDCFVESACVEVFKRFHRHIS